LVAPLLAIWAALGCGDETQAPPPDDVDERVPDFSIPDVNPASLRSGENVSPRDYEGRVSAWYFGHAT
jgi:hypothetical protein